MIRTSNILLPVAGSSADEEAISLACEIARQTRASIFAIYVIEVKRTLALDVDLPSDAAHADAVLAGAETVAKRSSVKLETEILQARDVGTAIVDEAVARKADLIIMGIPYKRQFGEFDVGHTAPYVLKNAPCRVWLAREPVESGADAGSDAGTKTQTH